MPPTTRSQKRQLEEDSDSTMPLQSRFKKPRLEDNSESSSSPATEQASSTPPAAAAAAADNGFDLVQLRESSDPSKGRTTEHMPAHKVAIIDEAMRKVQWLVNLVLHDPPVVREHLFLCMFRSKQYQSSIRHVFSKVRTIVTAYFDPSQPQPLGQRIVFLAAVNPYAEYPTTIAITSMYPCPVVTFFPCFWVLGSTQLVNYHRLRLEPPESKSGSAFYGGACTLLHELVHLVSAYWRGEFLSLSFSHDMSLLEIVESAAPAFDRFAIDDIRIGAAEKIGTSDQPTVSNNAGKPAYGMENCLKIAKLNHGAELALCNADSYAIFAMQAGYEYLARVFHDAVKDDQELQAADQEVTKLMGKYAQNLQIAFRFEDNRHSLRAFELGPSMVLAVLKHHGSDELRRVYDEKADEVRALMAQGVPSLPGSGPFMLLTARDGAEDEDDGQDVE